MNQPQINTSPAGENALSLLTDDHDVVRSLFADFNRISQSDAGGDEKWELVQQICEELILHTQLEEEIFYPAARSALDDDRLIDEAEADHAEVKDLITQLETMDASDGNYHEEVNRLAEMVMSHVKIEEEQLFPKVREANVDTAALGRKMSALRDDLMAEMESDVTDLADSEVRE